MNNRHLIILTTLTIFIAGCSASASNTIHEPLTNAANRATPLSFGLFVTPDPDNNPIEPPERFSGYHAATDFEISEGEVEGDVPVFAICRGRVAFSGYVDGYGGLIVQRCTINNEPVTVLYGHLDLDTMASIGTKLKSGQSLALLAANKSYDSGDTRKHLHLGIHRGENLDLRGYVQNEADLANYIDPATILPKAELDLPGESPGEIPFWQEELVNEEENHTSNE